MTSPPRPQTAGGHFLFAYFYIQLQNTMTHQSFEDNHGDPASSSSQDAQSNNQRRKDKKSRRQRATPLKNLKGILDEKQQKLHEARNFKDPTGQDEKIETPLWAQVDYAHAMQEAKRPLIDCPDGVAYFILKLDVTIDLALTIFFHLYMFVMAGGKYESPSRDIQIDTGREMMVVLRTFLRVFNALFWMYVLQIAYSITRPGVFLLIAVRIIWFAVTLAMFKYFVIYVIPINIAQAFARAGVKKMIGVPGSFFSLAAEAFIA